MLSDFIAYKDCYPGFNAKSDDFHSFLNISLALLVEKIYSEISGLSKSLKEDQKSIMDHYVQLFSQLSDFSYLETSLKY